MCVRVCARAAGGAMLSAYEEVHCIVCTGWMVSALKILEFRIRFRERVLWRLVLEWLAVLAPLHLGMWQSRTWGRGRGRCEH